MVERRSPKPDVEGSSPSGRDFKEQDIYPTRLNKVIKMNDSLEKTKQSIITYFRGVRTEWGKITWPEKNQVVVETFFVVAIVAIFTVFIYVVDILFNSLLGKI